MPAVSGERPLSSRQDDGSGTRISLRFPEGREDVWGTEESEMLTWQLGEVVFVRNCHWLVVGREEEPDFVAFTFAHGT